MTAAESELASEVHREGPPPIAAERLRTKTAQNLAAGLAHELRNPVVAIASAARLLRYRVMEDPVVEKNVGRILREAERLNALVSALLEYGNSSPLKLVVVDPDDLWDRVLRAERGVLESKALIIKHTAASPRVRVSVDVEQWLQVCSHLLANAIDAAPEGSDLTLVSTATPDGEWRSELVNAGPPVPPDALAHAFELLVSTKPGHSGIGLALAQRIVNEHGGTIGLESESERGTVATLTLPAARLNG